eukprot:jgi/Mesvir1/22436/Mv17909-RA.1
MPLVVIGAGFGRTATLSVKDALEKLGLGPCYHMKEVTKYGDEDKWIEAADTIDNKGGHYDFEKIFSAPDGREPFRSTIDFPSASYYKELMAQYPDAKVVLTVRESADKWYQSFAETVGQSQGYSLFPLSLLNSKYLKMMHATIWDKKDVFDGKFHQKGGDVFAKQVYDRWVQEVKSTMPKDKLLVFNVKQGWKPLCEFLNVPVPSIPFPSSNERAEVQTASRSLFKLRPLGYAGAALGAAVVAAAAYRVVSTHRNSS